MNIREIKALAGVLQQADLTALEYTEGDKHIRLERNVTIAAPVAAAAAPQPMPSAMEEAAVPATTDQMYDFNNMNEVKAPMVGVYYAAPSPDAKPFVQVGDHVEKGQTVCIIEAMKLMNDIVAPCSGEVIDICVMDGAVLEYGQTIMKIS